MPTTYAATKRLWESHDRMLARLRCHFQKVEPAAHPQFELDFNPNDPDWLALLEQLGQLLEGNPHRAEILDRYRKRRLMEFRDKPSQ